MRAASRETTPGKPRQSATRRSLLDASAIGERIFPILVFLSGIGAVLLAGWMVTSNRAEQYSIPALVVICVSGQLLWLVDYLGTRKWDLGPALPALLSLLLILALYALPQYLTLWSLNAVIHRSVFAIPFLLAAGILAMQKGIYYLGGSSPSAEDLSRYPILLVPVLLILGVYLSLLYQLVSRGLANVDWKLFLEPYYYYTYPVMEKIAGDWPKWTSVLRQNVGIRNHILGTGLLMLLTTAISLPIGAGAGIFLSEYAEGFFGQVARFVIASLRSISLLVLGLFAVSLITFTGSTPLAFLFNGFRFNGFSVVRANGGTFFAASVVLSLLVIPIITLATEEGCRSLPQELREGSLALGATEDTTLWRIILPWALPNLVTGVLLGCAEAAGDMAVLWFIAGRGDFGVGPFQQVTSLAYLIFDIWWGDNMFQKMMQPFQYTAGVLLMMITVGLGILALLLKRWLVKRYRGG